MSEDHVYKDGDIVWVKLNNVWWPGEVTPMQEDLLRGYKKRPYCVVKFFEEEEVEFVKTAKQIYPFQCQRKAELIKKGMDLFKAKNKFMAKFPNDVQVAEELSSKKGQHSDTIIIRDRPDSIVKAVMGEAVAHLRSDYAADTNKRAHRQSGDSITKIMNITPKLKTPALQHGRATQSNAMSSTPTSSSTPKMLSTAYTTPSSSGQNSNVYRCNWCDFQTFRQNVMILHRKTHSGQVAAGGPSPALKTTPARLPTPKVAKEIMRSKQATPPVASAAAKRPATPAAGKQRTAAAATKKSAALTKEKGKDQQLADITLPTSSPPPLSVIATTTPDNTADDASVSELTNDKDIANDADNDNEISTEVRNNGRMGLSATPPTTTTPIPKKCSEEIRKRLLADWSDEDEEGPDGSDETKDNEVGDQIESLPPTETTSNEQNEKAAEEVESKKTNKTSSSETPKDPTAYKSRSIRNIPKKDRRALKEFNTECSEVVSTEVDGVVIVGPPSAEETKSPASVPEIIDVDMDRQDDVIEVIEVDEEDDVEVVPSDSSAPTDKAALAKPAERNSLDNAGATETGSAVPLSCFDFQEDEDNDTDVLTSIANFKKKYLSPEKPPLASAEQPNEEQEAGTVQSDDATGGLTPAVAQQVQEKDLELTTQIENLLEQISSTMGDVCAVSVKTLPIKERGKRIFKSRNRSRLEESEPVPPAADSSTTAPLAEATSDEITPPTSRETNAEDRAEELELEAIPTNGVAKEKIAGDETTTEKGDELAISEDDSAASVQPVASEKAMVDPVKLEQVEKGDTPRVEPLAEDVQNGHSLSATDDTSSAGISEAGAEFGSPASMLDEERFPLAGNGDAAATPLPQNSKDKVAVETSSRTLENDGVIDGDVEHGDFFEEDEEEDEIESPPHEELSGNELEEEIKKVRSRLGKKSPAKQPKGDNRQATTPTPSPTSTMAEDSESSTTLKRSERTAKAGAEGSPTNLVTTTGDEVEAEMHKQNREGAQEPDTNFNEADDGRKPTENDPIEVVTKVPEEIENGTSKEIPEVTKDHKQIEHITEEEASKELLDEMSAEQKDEKSRVDKLEDELNEVGRKRKSPRRTPTMLAEEQEIARAVEKRSRRKPQSPAVEDKKSLQDSKDINDIENIEYVMEEKRSPIRTPTVTDDESSQNSCNYLIETIESSDEKAKDEKSPPNGRPQMSLLKKRASPHGKSTTTRRKPVDGATSPSACKVRKTDSETIVNTIEIIDDDVMEMPEECHTPKVDASMLSKQKNDRRSSTPHKPKSRSATPKEVLNVEALTPAVKAVATGPPSKTANNKMSFAISKRRTPLKSALPSALLKRKKSLDGEVGTFVLDTQTPTKAVPHHDTIDGGEGLGAPLKLPTNREELILDSSGQLKLDGSDIVVTAAPSGSTGSSIITTSSGMFDINDIPMVLSNDDDDLLSGAAVSGGGAHDNGQMIKNVSDITATLADTPTIIQQQILQPAQIPMNPLGRRARPNAEEAANESAGKQIGTDTRGNKYFIVKTTHEAALGATATTTLSAPSSKQSHNAKAEAAPPPVKPKSPAAAATGGRKQAGNTITLPGTSAVRSQPPQQQKLNNQLASTKGGLPPQKGPVAPSSSAAHRPRPSHLNNASPAPAKIPKTIGSGGVPKSQPQDLPTTSKAAQSLASAQGTVHPLLNRKPRTQPQQHRGSLTKRPSQTVSDSPSQSSSGGLRQHQTSSSGLKTGQRTSASNSAVGQQQQHQPPVVQTPQQAVHSTTFNEEQLGQMPTDDQNLEGASKILAVPTQPIPGYNETFLLCTLVNNSYRPIDNVPLYLDHDLNQLVPVPMEALDGQPHLIVNHPPPEEQDNSADDDVLVNPLAMSATNPQQQQQVLTGSLDTVEADSSTQYLCVPGHDAISADVTPSATMGGQPSLVLAADDDQNDDNEMAVMMEPDAGELMPNNALILNIEGQQIIMDSSTIAHLLANPDANTQLVTDDGTEFVLTREVLAALEAQQTQGLATVTGPTPPPPTQQQHMVPQAGAQDILAVALAGTDLYGNDVLEIETSQNLPLIASDGSIVFPSTAAALAAQAHLTPPITAHTSETNAVLNPIMSTLESPSTTGTTSVTAALLATSVAGDLPAHQRPNLEDSLAVIGVTAQPSSVPISLELPITVTNPAIAPPKTVLPPPPTDIEQFQSNTTVAELTAAAAAAINDASVFTTDPHS